MDKEEGQAPAASGELAKSLNDVVSFNAELLGYDRLGLLPLSPPHRNHCRGVYSAVTATGCEARRILDVVVFSLEAGLAPRTERWRAPRSRKFVQLALLL